MKKRSAGLMQFGAEVNVEEIVVIPRGKRRTCGEEIRVHVRAQPGREVEDNDEDV